MLLKPPSGGPLAFGRHRAWPGASVPVWQDGQCATAAWEVKVPRMPWVLVGPESAVRHADAGPPPGYNLLRRTASVREGPMNRGLCCCVVAVALLVPGPAAAQPGQAFQPVRPPE